MEVDASSGRTAFWSRWEGNLFNVELMISFVDCFEALTSRACEFWIELLAEDLSKI